MVTPLCPEPASVLATVPPAPHTDTDSKVRPELRVPDGCSRSVGSLCVCSDLLDKGETGGSRWRTSPPHGAQVHLSGAGAVHSRRLCLPALSQPGRSFRAGPHSSAAGNSPALLLRKPQSQEWGLNPTMVPISGTRLAPAASLPPASRSTVRGQPRPGWAPVFSGYLKTDGLSGEPSFSWTD